MTNVQGRAWAPSTRHWYSQSNSSTVHSTTVECVQHNHLLHSTGCCLSASNMAQNTDFFFHKTLFVQYQDSYRQTAVVQDIRARACTRQVCTSNTGRKRMVACAMQHSTSTIGVTTATKYAKHVPVSIVLALHHTSIRSILVFVYLHPAVQFKSSGMIFKSVLTTVRSIILSIQCVNTR